jgi:hypothetical protein
MIRTGAAVAVAALLALAGCKPAPESDVKAIIGAVLLDAAGRPPLSDSILVTSGTRIRIAGPRGSTPLPSNSERLNGAGKFIVPAPVNVYSEVQIAPPPKLRWIALQQSRAWPATETLLDAAAREGARVVAEAHSLHDIQLYVDSGVSAFAGIPGDTTSISPDFVRRLRDLQIVFAPMLSTLPARSAEALAASQNTHAFAAAGIPVAVACPPGGDAFLREMELLVAAGLSPSEVLIAATRNGALALDRLKEVGTLEPGKRADVLLLDANPAEDIRNLRQVVRAMLAGKWSEFPLLR